MSPLEILKEARELIHDSSHWTTSYYARDSAGCPCNYTASTAARFCALGAVKRVAFLQSDSSHSWVYANGLLGDAAWALWSKSVTQVNDLIGHNAVLACYDKAISLHKEQQ